MSCLAIEELPRAEIVSIAAYRAKAVEAEIHAALVAHFSRPPFHVTVPVLVHLLEAACELYRNGASKNAAIAYALAKAPRERGPLEAA